MGSKVVETGYIDGMRPFLLVAVVLFLIAAFGAFTASVHINQIGFLALGLAAFAADFLLGTHPIGMNRAVSRRRVRDYF